jgi:hypothetical protein
MPAGGQINIPTRNSFAPGNDKISKKGESREINDIDVVVS